MKLKFASGGAFAPPYVVYQPQIIPDSYTESSSKSKKSSKDSDEMGDITKLLDKMDGLPGDMTAVKGRINQLVNLIKSSEGTPGRTTTITNAYTELITLISSVNSQKQYYNEAKKHAQEKGSMNEIMLNDNGELRVLTSDGTLDWISLQKYSENREEYKPITNGQVLDLRYNGQLGLEFDTNSVTAASDGVSMYSIQNKIKEGLQNIEYNQVSRQGYVSTEQREVLKGIQTYKDVTKSGETISNLFKEKIIDKDQASQIEYAFSYIYNGLTAKEKALLQFKALDVEGGVMGVMEQLVGSRQGTQYEYEPVDEITNKGKKSDGKGGLTDEKMSMMELLTAGYGNQDKIFIQTTKGKNMALEVDVFSLPLMKGDSPLGANITLSDVMESTVTGGVDWKHATMGGADISSEAFNNIVIRGGSVYTGMLPVDIQALQNQQVKPDFNILNKFKELQKTWKNQKITNKEEINETLKEAGLPIMFDKEGFVINTNYRSFAMFNATALGNAFNEDVSLEDWLSEIEDMNQIGNVLRIIAKKHGVEDIDFDSKSWWDKNMPFWNKYTPVYKGIVFAPVEDSSISSRIGAGQDITPEQAKILHIMDQGRIAKSQNVQTFSDAGNNL